ncbi:MAG: DUF3313 domain-containing protein [Candidatus Accumulibacter phosphatis]|jgi:hypothetical protein|uniref:DUF3313 domain-containing protein n=2 Tax=Candidatus Accumulibacter TaxID=327159 RepID=A0A080LU55_9PROT|nr:MULTISPECIES: DUF3313 domain-containing protein [Candidatus Accumulibacter]KFB72082.1 MAG: hypothetical protein AW09_002741 [Candidatus Accumulibacter phosphatis]MBL8409335.1 DUF3313 domain-containing protein [Accumulibacter sp.]NMQ05939.1 DUF3313 domain-containing protein [Candidatus Accumulibacter contiguus]
MTVGKRFAASSDAAGALRLARKTAGGLLGVLLLAGCADLMGPSSDVTVSDPLRITRTGFLTDYNRLTTAPGGDGALCWRNPDLDFKRYNKVMITRILVSLKPDQQQAVDPTDLKALVDYFHASLVKTLKPQMQVVDQPGPGVIVLRIEISNLVPTQVGRSVVGTAIPYGFVAEAASGPASGRPAGSTPYLGETGIEMQFLDGASNVVLAECADTQIGRKYAADIDAGAAGATDTWIKGYMSSFQSWAYARDAFDKWSLQIANRFAVLRGSKAQ